MVDDDDQGFDDVINEDTMSRLSTAVKAQKILERSQEEGIPLKDLALDVQGGKIKAVTQREKKASDELRRKELIKKLRQRSIRGDNSLAEDISRRLRRCQEWIDYISRFSNVTSKDLITIKRNIESTNNLATSMVKELTVLEMAIERKKEEDPIISKVESASAELMEAIKNHEFERASELRQFCEENIPLYNSRKKRLKPYYTQARQARLKFLGAKRQVMRMQYDTGSQVSELLAKDLSSGAFCKFEKEALNITTKLVHELRDIRSKARVLIDKLSQPVTNVALSFLSDIEKEMIAIDETVITPFEEKVEQLMSTVGYSLKQIREETAQAEKDEKESKKRMAFQEKADKDKK